VHIRGGRHTSHRIAEGLGHEFLPVDRHPHDDRLQVVLRHGIPRQRDDVRGLSIGGARRRRLT